MATETSSIVTLKLDFDFKSLRTLKAYIHDKWRFFFLMNWDFGELTLTGCEVWRTFHGWHIYLTVTTTKPLQPLVVSELQAFLGSDHKREANNMNRILFGWLEDWNTLYKEKVENGKLVSKEINQLPKVEQYIMDLIKTAKKNQAERRQKHKAKG